MLARTLDLLLTSMQDMPVCACVCVCVSVYDNVCVPQRVCVRQRPCVYVCASTHMVCVGAQLDGDNLPYRIRLSICVAEAARPIPGQAGNGMLPCFKHLAWQHSC
jgi:hypothetical protein